MYNPKTHHRKSIRLREYDYSNGGWYYVTICTNNKEHLFGKVINNRVELNDYGRIVNEEWLRTKEVRENVDLDYFVIMPNHMHGVIIIEYNKNKYVGETRWVAPNKADLDNNAQNNKQENRAGYQIEQGAGYQIEQGASHRLAPTIQSDSLGSIIGQFKSICTKRMKLMLDYPIKSIWQRNYYEHIIRNDDDLYRIRKYIQQNPLKWQLDEYY